MARPREFDEDAVIKAARQQFWHHGYDGTSMADLCDATGLKSQSLYGAFGSKHELFVRTLDDYCVSQADGLAASEHAATSAWSWLMAAVTFDDGGRLGLGPDGCYLSGSAVSRARLDEEVEAASKRTYGRMLETFRTALGRARTDGELRVDADVNEIAFALLTTMQGIEFLRKSGIGTRQFSKAKAAAVATLTRAYAADGIRA